MAELLAAVITGENVAVLLFFIGLLGLVMRKNMMITVLAIGIMNAAIVLFFVTMTGPATLVPPMTADSLDVAADPVPQALMITSVVIGISVTAIMLVLALDYYRETGSLDWKEAQLRSQGQGEVPVAIGPVEPVAVRALLRANWQRLGTIIASAHPRRRD